MDLFLLTTKLCLQSKRYYLSTYLFGWQKCTVIRVLHFQTSWNLLQERLARIFCYSKFFEPLPVFTYSSAHRELSNNCSVHSLVKIFLLNQLARNGWKNGKTCFVKKDFLSFQRVLRFNRCQAQRKNRKRNCSRVCSFWDLCLSQHEMD